MASSAMLKGFCLGLLGLLILVPHAEPAIGCNQIYSSLSPCLGYLGGQPLNPRCCSNIKAMLDLAQTKPDRQTLCVCLKALAKSYSSSIGKAKEILSKCGAKLPYPLDPNIDCSKQTVKKRPHFYSNQAHTLTNFQVYFRTFRVIWPKIGKFGLLQFPVPQIKWQTLWPKWR